MANQPKEKIRSGDYTAAANNPTTRIAVIESNTSILNSIPTLLAVLTKFVLHEWWCRALALISTNKRSMRCLQVRSGRHQPSRHPLAPLRRQQK